MGANVKVKICGLSEPNSLHCAIQEGADFLGFVFYPNSPRYVSFEMLTYLSSLVPDHIRKVGLFVDPTDESIAHIVKYNLIDMLQLHGTETPERVFHIKQSFGLPVIKALLLHSPKDLCEVEAFESVSDWILFDSRPTNSNLPGGRGEAFDWDLLKGRSFSKPWMLSGGLTIDNVSNALSQLSPDAVDVSSGVEKTRGVKDISKIHSFIKSVKG